MKKLFVVLLSMVTFFEVSHCEENQSNYFVDNFLYKRELVNTPIKDKLSLKIDGKINFIFIGIIVFFYRTKLWNKVVIFFFNVFL